MPCAFSATLRREPPESTQAAVYYHQALVLAAELGMHPLQAHCHHGQGRTELSTAIALYRSMEMTFWLPQAEATLAQTGAAERPGEGVS